MFQYSRKSAQCWYVRNKIMFHYFSNENLVESCFRKTAAENNTVRREEGCKFIFTVQSTLKYFRVFCAKCLQLFVRYNLAFRLVFFNFLDCDFGLLSIIFLCFFCHSFSMCLRALYLIVASKIAQKLACTHLKISFHYVIKDILSEVCSQRLCCVFVARYTKATVPCLEQSAVSLCDVHRR